MNTHEGFKQLDDVLNVVKTSSMKDDGNVLEGIRQCSNMLKEMVTSNLTPKAYYELYISITEHLRKLQTFLVDEFKKGNKVENLYEIVQYADNIVPRMYLLITVGVVYIKVGESSKKEILRDLVEMCRGVQNPLRGLFLRSYLLHSVDSKLLAGIPESKVLDEAAKKKVEQSNLHDSIEFILLNFAEMNKLWVRMQHQGHTREKERREQDRKDLKLLVGTNLDRLSRLEGVDVEVYENVFSDEFHLATLHKLIEAIRGLSPAVRVRPILCSLIERLCQYFLDERESSNGTPKIVSQDAWSQLQTTSEEGAQMMRVVLEVPADASGQSEGLFALLAREVGNMLLRVRPEQLESRGLTDNDIPLIYHSLMLVAMHLHVADAKPLINYCLKCATLFLKHVGVSCVSPQLNLANDILLLLNLPMDGGLSGKPSSDAHRVNTVSSQNSSGTNRSNSSSRVPLAAMCSIRELFNMGGFSDLVRLLDARTAKRRLACHLLVCALERDHLEQSAGTDDAGEKAEKFDCRLTTEADLDGLLSLIDVLIAGGGDDPRGGAMLDVDELMEEQCLIAGVLHLIGPLNRAEDCVGTFSLLQRMGKVLNKGDEMLIRNTYPALVFELMQLLKAYPSVKETLDNWDSTVEQTVKFTHQCITKLIKHNAQETALRLFLETALIMDEISFEKRNSLVYEFLSQAFVLGEDGLPDSKCQLSALLAVISCVLRLRHLDEESYATLRRQCFRAATHLLRRPDQAKAVASTAHLCWGGIAPSAPKTGDQAGDVMHYFDKTYQLTDECMDPAVRIQLSVDLLNYCAQFRIMGCTQVKDEFVGKLLEKITSSLDDLGNATVRSVLVTYYHNTILFLQEKQKSDGIFDSLKFELVEQ